MGISKTEDGYFVSVSIAAKECYLLLFSKGDKPADKIPFPVEEKMGNVWQMEIKGRNLESYTYAFEADGVAFSDPCGHSFCGRERWGRLESVNQLLTSPIASEPFDWEGDRPLHIPYEDCIVYRAHVRGLTKHSSSKVKDKGTFAGVAEKIPYMKELGITTLELLPIAEFQEVMMPDAIEGNPYGTPEPTGKLNYWGYAKAYSYAPKASYAGKGKDPVTELKKLVKELHKAGIELVCEMYFTGEETPDFVMDVARYWVREFHIDGIHLMGQVKGWLLANDPYLADTKLWAVSWDGVDVNAHGKKSQYTNLAEYNDGYLVDMRRALKGDEEQMNSLLYRNRHNPVGMGIINYMAGTNGFTLMDMVSYEQKHNEANGENNQDGTDYNHSWNCGVEGPIRKKKIVQLRKKQIRNALLMLFLSQGTPLLLAGDEFGNSQNGNNNAYCQDNAISWLNWNQAESNRDILEFVRHLIAFRKAHPVFHMEDEPRLMDYLACGHPDVSYHGVNAWRPEFENFRRQIGILYSGEYGKHPDGTLDDYFFVAYNMHWEPHEFALPNLPKGQRWAISFDTENSDSNGFYLSGEEKELENQKGYMVSPRSIVVFVGKK